MTVQERSHIWIVEDDGGCREVVTAALAPRWNLRCFESIGALDNAADQSSDEASLVIADICLPDRTLVNWLGSPCAKKLLARVPLLVMSGLDEADVIRSAFEGGALDFLSKPFGRAELMVKVERALGEAPSSSRALPPPPYELDASTMVFRRADGQCASLTSKEMQIVALLWHAPRHTLTRDALQASLWRGCQVGPKTLDVHLSRLRRKLHLLGLDIRHAPPESVCVTVRKDAALSR